MDISCLIDPPNPYDPPSKWREFLSVMRSIKNPTPAVQIAIEEAERRLTSESHSRIVQTR